MCADFLGFEVCDILKPWAHGFSMTVRTRMVTIEDEGIIANVCAFVKFDAKKESTASIGMLAFS